MDRTKIDHCVETLGLRGCTAIWRIIADLEQDREVAEAAALSAEERQAVLAELKAIMAVYQGRK